MRSKHPRKPQSEASAFQVRPTSMVFPTANPTGYAAVPTANIGGFSFLGAVDEMNFSAGVLTVIAVTQRPNRDLGLERQPNSWSSATTPIPSPCSIPSAAVPPVDQLLVEFSQSPVCTIVPGFDRPVFGIVNGSTAYILNCGPQCGGTQASVAVFDLTSLTITSTIPVDAATMALLNGSTLYVAGTSPTNHACTGETTRHHLRST